MRFFADGRSEWIPRQALLCAVLRQTGAITSGFSTPERMAGHPVYRKSQANKDGWRSVVLLLFRGSGSPVPHANPPPSRGRGTV
jgi:hypothetical protein